MQFRQMLPLCSLAAVFWLSGDTASAAEGPSLHSARRLLLTGNYAEATEAYDALKEAEPVAAAVGVSRCLTAEGKLEEAIDLLTAVAKSHPRAAALHSEVATLEFERGRYEAAQSRVCASLELDENELQARWIAAELHRASGRMREADQAYRWLVDFYNRTETFDDAESLGWIGRGAAQYARWNRLNDQFNFIVNELYPEAIKLEPEFWQAHYEAGLLYAEKYNQPEATRQFNSALAINPRAAGVHAALAALALQSYDVAGAVASLDRADAVNPNLLSAKQLRADLHLINFQAAEGIETLHAALALNPRSETTLGRLAAAYVVRDGMPEKLDNTGVGRLVAQAEERNPHAGEFYMALAGGLELVRKYPAAGRFYENAIQRMPQLVRAHGDLGMIYMRLGREVEAKELLDEAFKIDPFNVRVSNTLKVLDVLSGYAVLETEHFVIKFDRAKDEILVKAMARFLEEEAYPAVCKRMGYEPQGKTLLEVFNHARNTDGHGWFSARMVGLPSIGTVGACAGQMFAVTSPGSLEQRFNWARVLKHELVHVVNLQQTDFNVPHWYTEGLAVVSEDVARPAEWNELLARRLAADDLFDLKTINFGFIRPASAQNWALAYCQAALYADYLEVLAGPEVHARMLGAYAKSADTEKVIQAVLNISQDEFEAGYRSHLREVAARVSRGRFAVQGDLNDLETRYTAKPDDFDLAVALAKAYLSTQSFDRAREVAQRVLKESPRHQAATYILARLHVRDGDESRAAEQLEACLDRELPDLDVLALLAGLKFKAKQFDEAAELYEIGAVKAPHDPKWNDVLARVYLTTGDDAKLAQSLARIAAADPDNLIVRKKLVQLAAKQADTEAIKRWAREGLQIDVLDPQLHRSLAEAAAETADFATATSEYEILLRLEPDAFDCRLALAKAYVASGRTDDARDTLRDLTKRHADYPGAKELLELLKR